MTGTEIVHVPYQGGAAAINDLIARPRAADVREPELDRAARAQSGRCARSPSAATTRSPGFPDLPTIAEAGVPGYEAQTWSGMIAPAGVPRPIVDKLNAAINRGLASKLFTDKLAGIGDEPAGGTPEQFAAVIARDSAVWREVVQRIGLKLGP